jgi:galactose oxidase-like protein
MPSTRTELVRTLPALAAIAAGATLQLHPIHESTPGPRNGHAAVYDLRDGSMVLFGGATASDVRGDTWRWKAGAWRRIPGGDPGPRTFPALAYDSARGEVILFGGNRVLFGDSAHPPAMLGDTWLLRNDAWTRAAVEGPSPRAEAAVAYDPRRRRTVLFGGYDLSSDGRTHRLGDTWEWDGRRWIRASETGPAPRSGAAMAYDPAYGVVLFGGSGGPLGDTWSWDGLRWARIPVATAPGRFNTVMARDPASGRLIRFGGWDGQGRVSDTWELCKGGWAAIDHGGPAARNHAALLAAPDRGSVLLYGGHDRDRVFGDLWERRDNRWQVLEAAAPVQRVANGH